MNLDDKIPKCLADGQLGKVKEVIYECPFNVKVVITFFSLFNNNTIDEEAHIFLKPSGVSRKVDNYTLAPGSSARVVNNGEILALKPGDIVEGYSTTAKKVDYVLSGFETVV